MPWSTQWVVFDLGGVLVRLGGFDDFRALLGARAGDDEAIWHAWLHCEWVQRYERGECTSEAFAEGVVESFRLPITPEGFMQRFRAWPGGLHPRARSAVEGLRAGLRSACLSNTNALHWEAAVSYGVDALFPVRFLSHEIGAVKPEPRAFVHVIQALGVPPRDILYLDDVRINVEAARRSGLDAHQARDADEAIRLLSARALHIEDAQPP